MYDTDRGERLAASLAILYARQLFSELPSIATNRSPMPSRQHSARRVQLVRQLFFDIVDGAGVSEFLEIGCHHAESSAAFVDAAPGRRAFAFDAIASVLEEAAAANAGKPIEFHNMAIGPQNGTTRFIVPREDRLKPWGSMMRRTDVAFDYDEIEVPMKTLATVADDLGIDDGRRTAAIWMDVEGAQLDILRSGCAYIRENVAAIYLEMYDHPVFEGGCTAVDALNLLIQCGFVPVARDNQFTNAYNLCAVHLETYDRMHGRIADFLRDSRVMRDQWLSAGNSVAPGN